MGNRMIGPGQDIFGLSQGLWGSVPSDLLATKDRDIGWMQGDDFTNFTSTTLPSSSLTNYWSEGNLYRAFEYKGSASVAGIIPAEAGWTVPAATNVYTPNGNAIRFAGGTVIPTPGAICFTPAAAADNFQLCLAANQARASALYPPGCFYPYPVTGGSMGDVFFECRFMLSGLTTGFTNFFIGLANTLAVASAVPCATTSFSTTPSYLGFGCLSGDPSGDLGMVWSLGGQAVQSQYMTGALTPLNLLRMGGISGITPSTTPATYPNLTVAGAGGIPTMVPGTYIGSYLKLGFHYDAAGKTLTPYINGIPQDGRIAADRRVIATTGIQSSTTYGYPGHATLWPAAPMTFAAGLWQTSSTYQTMTLDWWRCAQLVE